MKIYFFLLILLSNAAFSQQRFYDVSLLTIDSQLLQMRSYEGKRMMIAVASPELIENRIAKYMDSLQRVYPNFKMLIVPATDLGGSRNDSIVTNIRRRNTKKARYMKATLVKKSAGKKQNSLVSWLTNKDQNEHFDLDIQTDLQMYFISEVGSLYAVASKQASQDSIDMLLNQKGVPE